MIFSRPYGTLRAFKSYPGLSSWATLSRPCGTESGFSRRVFGLGPFMHRQRLALFGETREHLARVHADFYDFEGNTPANWFALLGQVYGAHATFAKSPNNLISAEVVISGCRCGCIDGLSSGSIRPNRTVESALDQAIRAQASGISGTQLRAAMRTIWHLDQSGSSNFMLLLEGAVTFRARFLIRGR